MPTTWKQEFKNLGVDPDVEIAERLGVSKERVRQVRKELNIARAPRRLHRAKRRIGNTNAVECLNAVPLSATDCQLLTDARLARGWSQTELANRTGGSLSFINAIEMGRKLPSPEFMNELCAALNLKWQFDYRLKVTRNTRRKSLRSRA